MEHSFLRDLVIVFASSALAIYVLHGLRVPSIVGFIATGIIIGPYGLGLIESVRDIEVIAEIGVVLLLFVIGVEFSMSEFMRLKRPALVGGGLQVAATTALIGGAVYLLSGDVRLGVFVGFLVALSSTAIVLKMLMERGETDSPHGRSMVGVLIFQDLCVVPMMLLIPFIAGSGGGLSALAFALFKGAAIVAFVLVAARWAVPAALGRIVSTRSSELFTISIIFISLGIALLTSKFGLSLALGAFLAGLIISESEYAYEATAKVLPFRDSFLGLFFVSVGMLIDMRFMLENIGTVMLAAAAIFAGKSVISTAVVYAAQGSPRVAAVSGMDLAQVGEFSFVLAAAGKAAGLFPEGLYQTFLSASLVTMTMTPFVINASPGVVDRLLSIGPLRRLGPSPSWDILPKALSGHVVIVGFGVVGRNLARTLRGTDISYVALELNNDIVRAAKKNGEPIHFGDGTSPETLKRLGIRRARLLLVAISDPAAARKIVAAARKENPELYIIVRTRYLLEVEALKALGADVVIPEEFEASVEVFSRVLHFYNVPRNVIDEYAEDIRQDSYRALRAVSAPRKPLAAELPMLSEIVTETFLIRGGSPFVGRSLKDLKLRTRTGATVMAVKRGDLIYQNPEADFSFEGGDIVLLVGKPGDIGRAVEYIESGGGPDEAA